MEPSAESRWEISNWQRDLVRRLPDSVQQDVVNAFYYFNVSGSSANSFFTNLLILLGASKYWAEEFPQAIAAESEKASAALSAKTQEFLGKVSSYAEELRALTHENQALQKELSREQRALDTALNSVWTRIASQLSNRRFIHELGEDLGQVLIESQDRVRPQIVASYEQLERSVQATADEVRASLEANVHTLNRTMESGSQALRHRWEEVLEEINKDMKAAQETKLELAKSHRELRRYAVRIEEFHRKAYQAAIPVVLAFGLVTGFLLAILFSGLWQDEDKDKSRPVTPPAREVQRSGEANAVEPVIPAGAAEGTAAGQPALD